MSSARRGLLPRNAALLVLCLFAALSGCSGTKARTYSLEGIESSISRILQDEYEVKAVVRLEGRSLWVYLPLPVLFEKSDKPETLTQKFDVLRNEPTLSDEMLNLDYFIRKTPPVKKTQDNRMNKDSAEKINHAWEAVRRVLFSLEKKDAGAVTFLALVAADIQNGIEISQTFFCEDIKKVTYRMISPGEYQKRISFGSGFAEEIVGDTEGLHVEFRDIRMDDFIAEQIKYRINLKFQEETTPADCDIDREVAKIVAHVFRIYNVENFSAVELNNLETKLQTVLERSVLLQVK